MFFGPQKVITGWARLTRDALPTELLPGLVGETGLEPMTITRCLRPIKVLAHGQQRKRARKRLWNCPVCCELHHRRKRRTGFAPVSPSSREPTIYGPLKVAITRPPIASTVVLLLLP